MFCYKCGANLPDDSAFCSNCGAVQPTNNTAAHSTPNAPNLGTNAPAQSSQNTYGTSTELPPIQQQYSVPVSAPMKKKSTKTPMIFAAASIAAIAAVIVAVILIAKPNSNKENEPSFPAQTTAGTNANSNQITTEPDNITDNIIEDEIEAIEGHYTVKDLAQYFGCTSTEIENQLGEPTNVSLFSQINLRYFYGDELSFLWIGTDGAPLSQITVSASILERNGETLDKTSDELIALLGVPKNEEFFYDEDGMISGHTMEYLLNKNAYVSFDMKNDKASTVNLTLYSDKLPMEMDYIKGLFEYSQSDLENVFDSPIYFYFDSTNYVNVLSYNAFTSNIDTDSGLVNYMEISANAAAVNGETLNKSSSEIISLLGSPADKGDYSDNYHKYFMRYILEEKWELTILMKDANSHAHKICVKPYSKENPEDVTMSYSTRDGYNSTLTLDPYGGFVLNVNRMSYFSNFSGTYQETEKGYKFEVAVGRGELEEFEMIAQGKNLIFYGENIGATINGVTTYYPNRTLDEIIYNGDSVFQALKLNGNAPFSVLEGEFNANQLTVDGKKLNITRDEIIRTLGAMRSEYSDGSTGEYMLTYYIVKSYTTFDVTFYFNEYDGKAQKVTIKELYVP